MTLRKTTGEARPALFSMQSFVAARDYHVLWRERAALDALQQCSR
ncbi:hypothetical protein [Bradyrhizobium sp. 141]|nr:hypothetical protein [Bradyrhizobium sp. 141]